MRLGLRACDARALFAKISRRPFASSQNSLWKKKKKKTTVFQATYVVVLQKVEKKDVIYTETVYNNKSFDKNLFWM